MFFPFDGLSEEQARRLQELFDCRIKTTLVVCGVFSMMSGEPLIDGPGWQRSAHQTAADAIPQSDKPILAAEQTSVADEPVYLLVVPLRIVQGNEEVLR